MSFVTCLIALSPTRVMGRLPFTPLVRLGNAAAAALSSAVSRMMPVPILKVRLSFMPLSTHLGLVWGPLALPPPPPFVDGEGELIAWLWAAWCRRNRPDLRFLLRSIDTDNIGIAMLMDPTVRDCVVVELKAVKAACKADKAGKAGKLRRLFNCAALACHSRESLRDQLLLFLVGGGSDYCRGITQRAIIPGCGIVTLLKHRRRHSAQLCDGTAVLSAFWHLVAFTDATALRPALDAVLWNLEYWAQVPPPPPHASLFSLISF